MYYNVIQDYKSKDIINIYEYNQMNKGRKTDKYVQNNFKKCKTLEESEEYLYLS